MSVLALVGCGSGSSAGGASGASGGQSVTLNISQLTPFKAGQDIVDKNFEAAHPNIHINATYGDNETEAQQVLTGLQAGNGPDVFLALPASGSPDSVWSLAKAGKLMNLSGLTFASGIPSSLRTQDSYQGKVYGAPDVETAVGILYNVALWKQLGLTAPTTLAQVLTLCGKAQAAGKTLFAMNLNGNGATGISSGLPIAQILMDEYVYATDPTWDAQRTAGTTTFATSPQWQAAYQTLTQMKNAGCFNSQPGGTTTTQSEALVVTGKAVGFMTSGAAIPAVQALDPSLQFKLIPFPGLSAADEVAAANSSAMVVNAATKYPQQAQEFINFISQPQQSVLFAQANGTISPYSAEHGTLPSYMSAFGSLYAKGKVVSDEFDAFPNPSMFLNVFTGYIPGVVSGQTSVTKLLQAADYLWEHPSATTAP